MTKKPDWEERSAEFEISFINLPVVHFEVEPEFVEPESALQRAHRRWGMSELLQEGETGRS
jgi:hypothetical protein